MNKKSRDLSWVLEQWPSKDELRWGWPEGAGRYRTPSLWQEELRMASSYPRALITRCHRYLNQLSVSAEDRDLPQLTGMASFTSPLSETEQSARKRAQGSSFCFLSEQVKKLKTVKGRKGFCTSSSRDKYLEQLQVTKVSWKPQVERWAPPEAWPKLESTPGMGVEEFLRKVWAVDRAGLSVSAPGSWGLATEEPWTTYGGRLLIFPVQWHCVREAGLHVILLGIPITSLVCSLNDLENGHGQILH